ncbi:MAG: hypothetical protein QXG25_02450, partial [Nitrososphaerota archaeon]
MGLTSPWIKYLLIFIVGGLAFMLIAPTLAMFAALLLMLLVIGLVFAFIIPGGWIFSSIASRSLFLLLSFRVLRKILVVGIIATATSFMLMVLARSSPAFLALSFISGGALALLLFAPSWPAFGWRGGAKGAAQPRKESIVVEVGRGGLLSREGLTGHELESGVLIVGARARTVARKIIGELAERGRRVVIIGSGRLIPEGARAE